MTCQKASLFLLLFTQKCFVYRHQIQKKSMFIPTFFFISFFSSSGTHQSQYLDGYQKIGKSSSFIQTFWALHIDSLQITQQVHPHCNNHFYHAIYLFVDLLQTIFGTYFNNHRHLLASLSHIPRVVRCSATSDKRCVSSVLMRIKYISGLQRRPLTHHIFLGGHKDIPPCTTK